MKFIVLHNQTESGVPLEAIFAPSKGMNLVSFKKGDLQALDLTTKTFFSKRCAGLGALIGPHFHHRNSESIFTDFDKSLFPHISKETSEPFSHGIARYVPWKYESSLTQIKASLKGSDTYKNTLIKNLEGFDFEMFLDIKLVHDGLVIDFRINSELPSVIGFHYYYHCDKSASVEGLVKPVFRNQTDWKPIPPSWYDSPKGRLILPLNQETDFGFQSVKEDKRSYHMISLKNPSHLLHVEYACSDQEESSWQLYHPNGASFTCIEPLSALNPKAPILTSSHIQIKISLF